MRLEQTYAESEVHEAWESVYRDRDPRLRAFNDAMMARFVPHFRAGPDGPILDAGCGVGDHALRLAAHGFETIGIDISAHVLEQARTTAERLGLAEDVRFMQGGLEELALPDESVAGIHCRGVLMHIPEWEAALAELCRVLKPGGALVVIENNTTSLETLLVRGIRLVRKGASRMKKTPGGIEFWMEREGHPFVWRIARIRRLRAAMRAHGVEPTKRMSAEFWDINRFPAGFLRRLALGWNRLWWKLRLPAFLSHGNVVIAVKR